MLNPIIFGDMESTGWKQILQQGTAAFCWDDKRIPEKHPCDVLSGWRMLVMLRHGGNRMRRTAAVFILLLVWMLLVEAGAAETTSDEAIGITLDSVDMVHIPEEQDEYLGCLRGIRIGIDPGHQEHGNSEKEAIAPDRKKTRAKVAPGTQGIKTQIPEYVTVLEISFALRDALVREGAEVYMTRETHEVNISNQERARMMNALGVDLVLRIHCNGSGNQAANGIGLYVNKSYPISAESRRAAEYILPRMAEATGARKQGIFLRGTYTGLNWSEVPSILVECGYMTNPEEDVKLNDPVYQQKLAEGMVEGICDYFGRSQW